MNTFFLLNQLQNLQSKGNSFFAEGLFPSYRFNKRLFYRRADENLFFTASIVFMLQDLRHLMNEEEQKIADSIIEKAQKAYVLFKNKEDLDTYNFYKTKPSKHFPNGYILHRLEHFRIPDDVDDTALVYITTPYSPAEYLHNKLSQHANGSKRWNKNTLPAYQKLPAYSTWFGKNMPIEFDACALCNLLYCLNKYNISKNEHDKASLAFLAGIIKNNEYETKPFEIAPNYATKALIIYHIARLTSCFEIEELNPFLSILKENALQSLAKEKNDFNRLLLSISLLKWGEKPTKIDVKTIQKGNFSFFIAGLLSAYQNNFTRFFASSSWVRMSWQCDAHDLALLLEYELYQRG